MIALLVIGAGLAFMLKPKRASSPPPLRAGAESRIVSKLAAAFQPQSNTIAGPATNAYADGDPCPCAPETPNGSEGKPGTWFNAPPNQIILKTKCHCGERGGTSVLGSTVEFAANTVIKTVSAGAADKDSAE